jgi:hypothetical protein
MNDTPTSQVSYRLVQESDFLTIMGMYAQLNDYF